MNSISDANGNVKLVLDEKELGNMVDIEVSCMGFEKFIVKDFHVRKTETKLGIRLISKIITMPEFTRLSSRDELLSADLTEGNTTDSKTWLGAVAGGIGYSEIVQTNVPGFDYDDVVNETDKMEYSEVPLKITAFPNPTTGVFTIESNKSNIFEIQVFDNNGKLIFIRGNLTGRETIDLSGYAAGIYYVNVLENGELLKTEKVVLAK